MAGLTIKMRLYGMFAAFVAGMLLVGGVGFYQMASINTTIRADFKEIQSGERDLIDIQNSNVAFKTQVQEWKNILLRGNDPAAFDKYQKGFEESEASVRKYLNWGARRVEKGELPPGQGRRGVARQSRRTRAPVP